MPDPAPIDEVGERLHQLHPDARYELDYSTPFQLLVATILAARCTDERVNKVTATLFVDYPDAPAFASADLEALEQAVRPTGSYKTKARAVMGSAQAIIERFGGEVPTRMEDLITLPGVARKTANVVLNMAFRIPSGVIVDSHVARVSRRMGLTTQKKGDKIEQDLMNALPESEWVHFGPAMVLFGRYICKARAPACDDCPMTDICPRIEV